MGNSEKILKALSELIEKSILTSKDFKKEIFKLIKKGAVVRDGIVYEDLKSFLSK